MGSAVKRRLYAAHLLDKTSGNVGDRLEPEVLVEGRGVLVDRIHHDKPCRRLTVRRHRSAQGIPEQLRSQTSALLRAVEGKPGKENGRDDIEAAAPGPLWQSLPGNEVRDEGEVGHHDSVARVPDERATCVYCARVESVIAQPAVEVGIAGVKAQAVVFLAQRLGGERQPLLGLNDPALPPSRLLERRVSYRRLAERPVEPVEEISGQGRGHRRPEDLLGPLGRGVQYERADGLIGKTSGLPDLLLPLWLGA